MTDTQTFDICVAEGFVLTELAAFVDVLRVVNRVNPTRVFDWSFLSLEGGQISSSAGATVDTQAFSARPSAQYLIVIGNSDPDLPALSMGRTIALYTNRQARVVLLAEAASRYIAENGGASDAHTTHWENRAILTERDGLFGTKATFAVESGGIITCAGMGSSFDVALSIASQHAPSTTILGVTDILLHERIRHFNTLQPFSGQITSATGDPAVDACIALMQDNVEFPLPISEIADHIGLSKRSLERKFNTLTKTTPNGFYRMLRLNKANNLLLNTDMKIQQIGLACGFPSGFTAIYRKAFGVSPKAVRNKGRVE